MSSFSFFFKQKTAYEIKECDWSSDVCSSDLPERKTSSTALMACSSNWGQPWSLFVTALDPPSIASWESPTEIGAVGSPSWACDRRPTSCRRSDRALPGRASKAGRGVSTAPRPGLRTEVFGRRETGREVFERMSQSHSCAGDWSRLKFRLGHDHQLNAIKQFPVAAFKPRDNVSRRSLQIFSYLSAVSAVRAIVAFVGVESDAVDVGPVFDRNAGDEFTRFERKGVAANVFVPARATDFGKSAVIGFEQNAIDVLAMPKRDTGDASRRICKNTVRDATRAATFLSKFLRLA